MADLEQKGFKDYDWTHKCFSSLWVVVESWGEVVKHHAGMYGVISGIIKTLQHLRSISDQPVNIQEQME